MQLVKQKSMLSLFCNRRLTTRKTSLRTSCSELVGLAFLAMLILVADSAQASGTYSPASGQQKSPQTICVDEQALAERQQEFEQKKIQRLPKYRTTSLKRSSMLIDVSGMTEPIAKRQSLAMNINAVRSKTYLQDKKIVLVGDGFNDEVLMGKAVDLESLGFRDVKVLANGRRSTALTNADNHSKRMHKPTLHSVNATVALAAAASSRLENEYLFLLLGEELPQLDNFGISYSSFLGANGEGVSAKVESVTNRALELNEQVRIVIVANDKSIERKIRASTNLDEISNYWFLDGGREALSQAIQTTRIVPTRQRNHKLSCLNG